MIRIFAYFSIFLGVLLLGDAAYDEHRGVAEAASPAGVLTGVSLGTLNTARRDESLQTFRNLMLYQWMRGPLALIAGFTILGLCRRADKADPFSPTFIGDAALDELNRTLTNEQERRRRPIR